MCSISFDFARAEGCILSLLASKPAIHLELRLFNFTNEQVSASLLRTKVAQNPLPPEVRRDVARDLASPSEAQACLDTVLVCISFLQGTGTFRLDEEVGETFLVDYVANVLLMKNVTLGSRTLAQFARLKHLAAVRELLEELTDPDIFSKVSPKYKVPFPRDDASLAACAAKCDLAAVLPLLREFISSQLAEEHLSGEAGLVDSFGYTELNGTPLVETTWFQGAFQPHWKLKHAVAIYLALKEF